MSELITTISESIDEETQCITLSIPAGSTHIIHSGETETYCYIELEQGSWSPALSPGKLIIEDGGTLNLTRFNDITTGQISNYGVLNIDSLYIKTGQNNGFSTTFYNAGTINATRGISFGKKISDYNYDYSDSEYLTITCGSVINANNGISFYINKPYFKVIGKMISPSITIYNSDGYNYSGNLVVDACAEIRTENLTINGNVNNIKIYGHIAADNINSSKELIVSDDEENQTSGILTIGGLTTGIKYSVNEKSILNLCYNPTKSLLHNKVSSGIYVNDVDLEKSEDGADYIGICEGLLLFLYGEETGYSNDWTPEDESDINGPKNETDFWNYVNGHNKAPKAKSTVAAYSSYDNCMNELNIDSFLPIELTYFKITDGNFEWETKSEMDNDYFVIEYSKNGTDWTECTDHIQSQSNTGWTYSCPVPETTKGSTFSYYRLKQVDLDGTFTYSDILSTSWKVPTLQSVRSQSVRCNILGQYSDKFGPVMIYNGEKRVIMKE